MLARAARWFGPDKPMSARSGRLWLTECKMSSKMADLLPLLLTSKEVNVLATELWDKNDYLLLCPANHWYDRVQPHPFPLLRASFARYVRRLGLNFLVRHDMGRKPFVPTKEHAQPNAWSLPLSHRKRSVDVGAAGRKATNGDKEIAWQKGFGALRELTVILMLDKDAKSHKPRSSVGCVSGPKIEKYFRRSYTYFSTRKFVVKVDGLTCSGYSTDDIDQNASACPHECAERVAKGFERLVEIKT
jgi:hypothetical protein